MSNSSTDRTNDSEVGKVVIEQRLLKLDETFVYKIPAMKTANGHRAEDWNLASPLATCSLIVNRRDDSLCINIMGERPKANAPPGATESYLFAQSIIQVKSDQTSHKLEHWVEPVVDSSRYFALRIRDPRSGREVFIGIGFRERNDATNFRMTMEDYVNALLREEKAQILHEQFERSQQDQSDQNEDAGEVPLPSMSSLSLKEGEKIRINIKGGGSRRITPTKTKATTQNPKKGLLGLRKPPPPPSNADNVATNSSSVDTNATPPIENTDEDDDEWGDFKG